MKIWYDTEFLEDGRTIELISIGMVREDGAEYYAVSKDATKRKLRRRIKKHDWLMANVVPSLPKPRGEWILNMPKRWLFNYMDHTVKPRHVIACEVRDFILGTHPDELPYAELWADWGAYDHVALCQLWGTMVNLPEGIPMWTHDLRQEIEHCGVSAKEVPPMPGAAEHNALHDAREVKWRHDWLKRYLDGCE